MLVKLHMAFIEIFITIGIRFDGPKISIHFFLFYAMESLILTNFVVAVCDNLSRNLACIQRKAVTFSVILCNSIPLANHYFFLYPLQNNSFIHR